MLPESFPPAASFFDVEGIPVSLNAGVPGLLCAAWDSEVPRSFPVDSMRRNGSPIPEAIFRRLVADCRDSPARSDADLIEREAVRLSRPSCEVPNGASKTKLRKLLNWLLGW